MPPAMEEVSAASRRCHDPTLTEEQMEVLSLHDILIAWRDGRMDYQSAMDLAQIDTLGELYDAAEHSSVEIRTERP